MYSPQAQGNYVSILEYIEDLVRVVAKGTTTTSTAATPESTGSGRGVTGWMLPTPTCLLDELKTLANHPTDDGTNKETGEQGTPRVIEVGGESKGETKGESASMGGGLMTEQSSSSMDMIDTGGEGSNTAGEEGVGCESKSPSNNAPGAGEEVGVETGAQTTDVDAMELAALMLQALANNYTYRDQPFRCCGDMPDALPWTSQIVTSAASSPSSSVPFPATTDANDSSLDLFHVMDAPATVACASDSGGEAKGVEAIESKESAEESTTPGEGDTVSFCVSGTVLLGGVGIPPRCIPTTDSEGGGVHALELVVNHVVVRNTKEQTHGIGESSGGLGGAKAAQGPPKPLTAANAVIGMRVFSITSRRDGVLRGWKENGCRHGDTSGGLRSDNYCRVDCGAGGTANYPLSEFTVVDIASRLKTFYEQVRY